MQKNRKIIITLILMIILISSFQGIVFGATQISSANLKGTHDITTNMQFDDPTYGWVDLISKYVCYTTNGKSYPAYCINNRNTRYR